MKTVVKYTKPEDIIKRSAKEDEILESMIYDYMKKDYAKNKKKQDEKYRGGKEE